MHEILDLPDTNIHGFEFSDSLTEEDLEALVSTLRDSLEQYMTTRVIFVMKDVDDWSPEERWEDLSFDVRHLQDLDKVAIVGDDLWEPWLDKVEILFPMSEIQVYDEEDYEEAEDWIRGDMEVPGLGPGSVPDPEAGAQDVDE